MLPYDSPANSIVHLEAPRRPSPLGGRGSWCARVCVCLCAYQIPTPPDHVQAQRVNTNPLNHVRVERCAWYQILTPPDHVQAQRANTNPPNHVHVERCGSKYQTPLTMCKHRGLAPTTQPCAPQRYSNCTHNDTHTYLQICGQSLTFITQFPIRPTTNPRGYSSCTHNDKHTHLFIDLWTVTDLHRTVSN